MDGQARAGQVLDVRGRLVREAERPPQSAPLSHDSCSAAAAVAAAVVAAVQASSWEARAAQLRSLERLVDGLVGQVLVDVVDTTGRDVAGAGRLLGLGRPTAYRRLSEARAYRAAVDAL